MPSRFTEEQIAEIINQVGAGMSAAQACRTLGVTQTTFYRWRRKYGGGGANELRDLRDENQKLKQIVVNLLLDKVPNAVG